MKRSFLYVTLCCIALVQVLNIGFLYQYQYIIDALANQQASVFLERVGLMVIIVVAMLGAEYGRQLLNVMYLNGRGLVMHQTLIGKWLKMPMEQFSENAQSYYLAQVTQDIEEVKEDHDDALLMVFQGVCTLIIASTALWSLNTLTAFVVLGLSVLPVVIPYVYRNKSRQLQNTYSHEQKQYTTQLSDYLDAFVEIRNAKSEAILSQNLKQGYAQMNHQHLVGERHEAAVNVQVGAAFYAIVVMIMFIGGQQVLAGHLTLGGLTVVLAISEQLVDPINTIASSLLSRHRIQDVLQSIQDDVPLLTANTVLDRPLQYIEVQNLTYQRNGQYIFNQFSCRFEQGKRYLIVGASGKGKSTLASLLMQNLPITQGDITFNQTSSRDLAYSDVQSLIAYLPQQGHLFNQSVWDNIAFGKQVEAEEVMQLIQVFQLNDRFPDLASLNEVLTDDTNLSGGQKQRLILIRALLEKKPILLLDESLSALDPQLYGVVEQYLTQQFSGMLIHISHRSNEKHQSYYDEVIRLT